MKPYRGPPMTLWSTAPTIAFSVALGFALPCRGGDLSDAVQKTLDAFCGLNLRYIEKLFDATRTTCRITSYRQGLIILFTAEKPVFRVPAGRKAWAMVAVVTAGKTIRDLGGSILGIDYVGLTDSEQAKSGKVVRFPVSVPATPKAA